jgi:prevent-host-death family protein
MQRVGAREFKNRMARYMRAVGNGETLLVVRHGKPVAKVVPPDDTARPESPYMKRLMELEAQGKVRLGTGRFQDFRPVKIKGKPISKTVIEDRR